MRLNMWDFTFATALAALVARHTTPCVADLVEACHLAERTADMAMRTREAHLKALFGADYRGGGKKPKPKVAKKTKTATKPEPLSLLAAVLVEDARSGHSWRDAALSVVAHWITSGKSNAEIIAMADRLTLPGYTVEQTRSEMRALVDSARRKLSTPPPAKGGGA